MSKLKSLIGKYVVVRTYSAGVHVGFLDAKKGPTVQLSKTRRIWSWEGAFTLSAVALDGIKGGCLPQEIPFIQLEAVIEIIPCSEKGEESLRNHPIHQP